jgi:tryptophanyl-tRNA synthetase
MYKADVVPVGEDQVAHVELTREIARRFNSLYPRHTGGTGIPQPGNSGSETNKEGLRRSSVFPEPQVLLTRAPKLPGTDGRKMSKSYGNAILLTDPEPVVRQKLKTMVTDPARVRRSDPGNPDVCPVGDLHKIFSDRASMDKVNAGCRSAGIGCIECKSWAADALVQLLSPMQERRKKFEENPRLAWDILETGSERARKVAAATMDGVREAMGMSLEYEPPAADDVGQEKGAK